MTGVDDPYEMPESPEIRVATSDCSPADSAEVVLSELQRLGWLPPGPVEGGRSVASSTAPAV